MLLPDTRRRAENWLRPVKDSQCPIVVSVTSFLMENEAIINYFYWQPEQNIYHVGCLLAVVGGRRGGGGGMTHDRGWPWFSLLNMYHHVGGAGTTPSLSDSG